MSWVRYDDGFHDHPKVMAVRDRDPGAIALHVLANTWTSRTKHPGFVPLSVPRQLVGTRGPKWAALLVEARLWHEVDGGWEFHDHEVYRAAGSRQSVGTPAELSAKRAAAGSKGGKTTQQRKQTAKQPLQQNEQASEQPASNRCSPVVGTSTDPRGSSEVPTPVPPSAGASAPPRSKRQPAPGDVQRVVGAWVDAATESTGERPTAALVSRFGKQARALLGEGREPDALVEAAVSCGAKGFDDLSKELLVRARGNGRGRGGQAEESVGGWNV